MNHKTTFLITAFPAEIKKIKQVAVYREICRQLFYYFINLNQNFHLLLKKQVLG